MKAREDYDQRRLMWLFLSDLFTEADDLEYVWLFNEDDRCVAGQYPDGSHDIAGLCKGIG